MTTHSRKIINGYGPVQNPGSTETGADLTSYETVRSPSRVRATGRRGSRF